MLPTHKHSLAMLLKNSVAHTIETLKPAQTAVNIPAIILERPKAASHGDIACNIAMQLAKPLGQPPRQIAQHILNHLQSQAAYTNLIEQTDIAGPGFINFKLKLDIKQSVIKTILEQQEQFGHASLTAQPKTLIEYVSANPTGPLHVGHGRQGVLGDILSNILASQGHSVHREFYYNDAGVQIHNLAISVQARAQGLKPDHPQWPEAAYNGEYVAEIAEDYLSEKTVCAKDGQPVKAKADINDLNAIREFAVTYLRHEQDKDLAALGIHFDEFYLESSLYKEGRVEKTVQALIDSGKTFEQGGALWLKTTEEGDDKDRVMRKADGSYTYFVPDVAYHVTKWQRGFKTVINIQGSDHHGTIARVRAGLQSLNIGIPKDYPHYLLHKMVTVMKDGMEVKLSKRAGSYVTIRDLIEWSGGAAIDHPKAFVDEHIIQKGRDAVRFFLVSRKADTEFVFDIDLALKNNDENPVYYIQYAHARICSILQDWKNKFPEQINQLSNAPLHQLNSDKAIALMQKLAEYPDMLIHCAQELTPHLVAFYLRELASEFHAFYNSDRVLVDDAQLRLARIALLMATQQVLLNGLTILGVSAPQKM